MQLSPYRGYEITVKEDEKQGGYVGTVTGMFSIWGQTLAKITDKFHKIIDDHIKIYEERGDLPIPPTATESLWPYTVTITVNVLTFTEQQALEKATVQVGRGITDYVRVVPSHITDINRIKDH